MKTRSSDLNAAMSAYKDFWKDRDVSKDLTAEEKNEVISLGKKADDLTNEVAEIKAMADRLGVAEQFEKDFNKPANALGEPTPANGKGKIITPERKDFSQLLAEKFSDEAVVKALKEDPRGFKTIITSGSSSAGDLLSVQRLDNLYDSGTFRKQLSLLDIVRSIPVKGESVEWPFLDSVTNNAAETGIADAIATTDDTGRFAESAMAWDKKSATMKWIGHTIPVPESVLDDIPQLMGYINEFMIYGIRERIELQMIAGDGSGETMTGILETTGTQTQAFSNSMIETLRKAKTKAQYTGKVLNAQAVLTPANWEAIELTLDAESRYIMGGPVGVATPTLWGMPIIINENMTTNMAIVGGFQWCTYFDRKQIEVTTHYENRDFAEKNLVGIRARARGQFGVIRPKAFVETTMA